MPRARIGYVDLHNHLLWGIDDGCARLEESLESARILVAMGFEEIESVKRLRHSYEEWKGLEADPPEV